MQLRISHLAVRSTGLPCTGSHRARALRSPHDARACTCARPRWRAGTCSTSARRPAELEQGREHVRPVAFSTCTVSSACVSSRCRRRTRSGRCASSCRSRSSSARRSRASPARAHGTDHANVGGRRRRQQRDAGTRAGMAPQWESGDRAATLRNAPTCCAVMPASNFMPRLCVCLDRNKIL